MKRKTHLHDNTSNTVTIVSNIVYKNFLELFTYSADQMDCPVMEHVYCLYFAGNRLKGLDKYFFRGGGGGGGRT
jgi:hypothetical protein